MNNRDEKIKVFSKKNIPAYFAIMVSMVAISFLLWVVYLIFKTKTFEISYFGLYRMELLFSFVNVIGGMMIMFIASYLSLRKMKKGWEEMAEGKRSVKIPPVWCPVLTAAKDAAEQLIEKIHRDR
ncbi:MAG: hypothetical protein NC831_03230 [Candidatus Omnitrophica bacterium]|nr:hypothetical protein [Candidatus Omnitrophota bacterium]